MGEDKTGLSGCSHPVESSPLCICSQKDRCAADSAGRGPHCMFQRCDETSGGRSTEVTFENCVDDHSDAAHAALQVQHLRSVVVDVLHRRASQHTSKQSENLQCASMLLLSVCWLMAPKTPKTAPHTAAAPTKVRCILVSNSTKKATHLSLRQQYSNNAMGMYRFIASGGAEATRGAASNSTTALTR